MAGDESIGKGGGAWAPAERHGPVSPRSRHSSSFSSPPQTGAIRIRVAPGGAGMKRALALLVGGADPRIGPRRARAGPDRQLRRPDACLRIRNDNITDFKNSEGGLNRDSKSFYFQRWRLFTNVESADKKARAVWALEVGDITWGTGGGASSANSTVGCNGGQTGTNPAVTLPPPPGSPPGTPPTTPAIGASRAVDGSTGQRVGAAASALTASTSRPRTSTSGPTRASGCRDAYPRSVSGASSS